MRCCAAAAAAAVLCCCCCFVLLRCYNVSQVWKHQALRIAYVAQHSLHHVEEHMDSSPVDYIKV